MFLNDSYTDDDRVIITGLVRIPLSYNRHTPAMSKSALGYLIEARVSPT